MKIKDLEKLRNEGADSLNQPERRNFLKLGLTVTGVFLSGSVLSLTTIKSARGLTAGVIPTEGQYSFKTHYSMVMRQDRCIDCEKCVVACNETNHVPKGHDAYRTEINEKLTVSPEGFTERVFRPVLCNHCNRPPCVRVCPTKATYKDTETGIVMMDDKKCIGCKTCMAACPYNARYFSEEKRSIDKCNFCWDTRLSKGMKTTACAEACPAQVRVFGDLLDKKSDVYNYLHTPDKKIWVLRPETGALPNVFYINF